MADFNINGKNFDITWNNTRQELINQGNKAPTTADIVRALVQKATEAQNNTPIPGFHLEHEGPVMKYGANIGCKPNEIKPLYAAHIENPEPPVMKYGANIGCKPNEIKPLYAAHIENPEPPVMKYGANIGCKPNEIKPLYAAHIENPEPPVMKYGANIGCKPNEIKPLYAAPIGNENNKIPTTYVVQSGQSISTIAINNLKLQLGEEEFEKISKDNKKFKKLIKNLRKQIIDANRRDKAVGGKSNNAVKTNRRGISYFYKDATINIPKFDLSALNDEQK